MLYIGRIAMGDLKLQLHQIYSPAEPVPGKGTTINVIQPELSEVFGTRPQPGKVNICTYPVREGRIFLGKDGSAGDHG